MYKSKKVLAVCSFVFLCLFLIFERNKDINNKRILSIPIVDFETVKENREENSLASAVLYNDSPVVFEESTNTIYIPQNIYVEQWREY